MTESRGFDFPFTYTAFLRQELHWYKMPIRDPISLGLYTAENLLSIYKVQRAKGHCGSHRKPENRMNAKFHWVNAYNSQSARKLKVLFTVLRLCCSLVVLTSLPW